MSGETTPVFVADLLDLAEWLDRGGHTVQAWVPWEAMTRLAHAGQNAPNPAGIEATQGDEK